jgi:hypothetical protein
MFAAIFVCMRQVQRGPEVTSRGACSCRARCAHHSRKICAWRALDARWMCAAYANVPRMLHECHANHDRIQGAYDPMFWEKYWFFMQLHLPNLGYIFTPRHSYFKVLDPPLQHLDVQGLWHRKPLGTLAMESLRRSQYACHARISPWKCVIISYANGKRMLFFVPSASFVYVCGRGGGGASHDQSHETKICGDWSAGSLRQAPAVLLHPEFMLIRGTFSVWGGTYSGCLPQQPIAMRIAQLVWPLNWSLDNVLTPLHLHSYHISLFSEFA